MIPIDLVQRRIANISVGGSTVRGQPKGTLDTARKYLASIDLRKFSTVTNEEGFNKLLNEHTRLLQENLPSQSWGISRKVLNIFLFQATHDIFLNKKYSLNAVIQHLELPLDNPNAKNLKRLAKAEDFKLHWKNIYSLEPDVSAKLQKYAKKHAHSEYQCARCYLDVYWWRSNK